MEVVSCLNMLHVCSTRQNIQDEKKRAGRVVVEPTTKCLRVVRCGSSSTPDEVQLYLPIVCFERRRSYVKPLLPFLSLLSLISDILDVLSEIAYLSLTI